MAALEKFPSVGIPISESQNSFARAKGRRFTQYIAQTLHDKGAKADVVTRVGAGLVIGGSILAAIENRNPGNNLSRKIPIAAIISLGEALDGVDGTMATIEAEEREDKKPSENGDSLDSWWDRMQEGAKGGSRMFSAFDRGDEMGMNEAADSTITNLFPSIVRASLEKQGKVADEGGGHILKWPGTRAGRAVFQTIATVFPEVEVKGKKIPVQRILDALTIGANLATTYDRLRILNDRKFPVELPKEKIQKAEKRIKVLAGVGFGIAVTALGTAVFLNHRMHRDNTSNAYKL